MREGAPATIASEGGSTIRPYHIRVAPAPVAPAPVAPAPVAQPREPPVRQAQTPGPPMPTTASAQPVDEVAPKHVTASEAVARHEKCFHKLPLPTRPTREDELVCQTCGTVTELGAWCTRCGVYNCILNNEQCIVTHEQQCQGLHSDDDTDVDTDNHLTASKAVA